MNLCIEHGLATWVMAVRSFPNTWLQRWLPQVTPVQAGKSTFVFAALSLAELWGTLLPFLKFHGGRDHCNFSSCHFCGNCGSCQSMWPRGPKGKFRPSPPEETLLVSGEPQLSWPLPQPHLCLGRLCFGHDNFRWLLLQPLQMTLPTSDFIGTVLSGIREQPFLACDS
jgi:hypothetical protein